MAEHRVLPGTEAVTELEGIPVELPYGRVRTMQALVDGWQRHVARLAEEIRGPVRKETWGAHDYFAALSLRDHIESGRSGLHRSQDHLVSTAVAEADELLRVITEKDRGGLVIRYGEPGPIPFSRWWWRRIPTGGLVREELDLWPANSD